MPINPVGPRTRPLSTDATGDGAKVPAALDLAKRMHMAAVGEQWKTAEELLGALRKELSNHPTALSAEQRQVVATRLQEAGEAAKRGDERGTMAKVGGVLALGIPFAVDALTTNDAERLAKALAEFPFEKPAAASPAKPPAFPLIDLHADTAMHAMDLGEGAKQSLIHKLLGKVMPHSTRTVTLDSLSRQPGGGLQVLTAYEEGLPPFPRLSHRLFTQLVCDGMEHANDTPMNQFVAQLTWIRQQAEKYPDDIVLQGHDANVPKSGHAVQIAVEGARIMSPGKDDAEKLAAFLKANEKSLPAGLPIPTAAELATVDGRLDFLARVGVTYMGIVHMGANDFAGTDLPGVKQLHGLTHEGNGLTPAGRELVKGMDRRGILIDLAHASLQTQREVGQLYADGTLSMPVIVSHGVLDTDGDRAWRDTPEETLRLVRESGGVFGVMLSERYWDKGLKGPAGVVDQIEKAIEVAGVDHVSLGSDADGFVSLVIEDMGGIGAIVDEMKRRGFSGQDIEKICSGNYLRTVELRQTRIEGRQPASPG